jgi:predicted nuclease of predicted toxin-antitoxin system
VKVLVDVNLSPGWAAVLAAHHIEAVHWTSVGDPRATDAELMGYARDHGYVVFTHDLDFGTLLAWSIRRRLQRCAAIETRHAQTRGHSFLASTPSFHSLPPPVLAW